MEVENPCGTLWKRARDNCGIMANIPFLSKTVSNIHGCMWAVTEFLIAVLFTCGYFNAHPIELSEIHRVRDLQISASRKS